MTTENTTTSNRVITGRVISGLCLDRNPDRSPNHTPVAERRKNATNTTANSVWPTDSAPNTHSAMNASPAA